MSDAFDENALMDRVDGDVEFLQETITMLEEDSPALLDEIHAAARSRNAANLVKAAHALKGMLANFCAEAAETAALELETMGRKEQLTDVDTSVARVMYIIHEQTDDAIDTFSHLGDTKNGIDSDNGMVVFGFGRGPQGIEPLLTGNHSFRIGLREGFGNTPASYEKLSRQFTSQLKRSSKDK